MQKQHYTLKMQRWRQKFDQDNIESINKNKAEIIKIQENK